MAMIGLRLSRQALLCFAAASAGQFVWRGPARAADLPSTRAASSTRLSTARLIPRHVLFGGADRSIVRLSPDGRRIAFLAPLGGVLNLWVADVRYPTKARSLTRVTDRDLGPWIVWLPNNRHVMFFRDQGGDENWQAHRVDLDTGGPGARRHLWGELRRLFGAGRRDLHAGEVRVRHRPLQHLEPGHPHEHRAAVLEALAGRLEGA